MRSKKELIIRVLTNFIPDEKLKKSIRQNHLKNYSLNSGERQTAKSLAGIRRDHIARYELVLDYIKENTKTENINILDMFCGNGYGSFLISEEIKNAKFLSIDGSRDAVNLAKKHYKNKNIKYQQKFFPFSIKEENYDYVISLESIEHVRDDIAFLQTIYTALKKNGILFLSTPNENKQSLKINESLFL